MIKHSSSVSLPGKSFIPFLPLGKFEHSELYQKFSGLSELFFKEFSDYRNHFYDAPIT
ncbi:MAG: hypothetical protein HQM10_22165 [Candidatus Riflebacteria bacterium]|nr:hypothetical protein [Candidatus Riflebacteria bacterium]